MPLQARPARLLDRFAPSGMCFVLTFLVALLPHYSHYLLPPSGLAITSCLHRSRPFCASLSQNFRKNKCDSIDLKYSETHRNTKKNVYTYGPFSTSSFHFGVGLSAYFISYSPLLREHIFVGLNKFPSLLC